MTEHPNTAKCRGGPLDGQMLTAEGKRYYLQKDGGFYMLSLNPLWAWFTFEDFDNVGAALVEHILENKVDIQ